jgi:hypothetical protein
MCRLVRRITFILGWLLVLALAQISLNPTIGLMAVVACAAHIGLMLGRVQPRATTLTMGTFFWVARQLGSAIVRLSTRMLRRRPPPSQAETIGIEVHVAVRRRSVEIEHLLRSTLRQCARTWAPHPLPIDRVTVHAGAPPAGRADVYERWLPSGDPQQGSTAPLAVISVGLLDATGRPLEDQQLAGALATQVATLVAERYQRQQADVQATGPVESKPSPCPTRRPAADLVDPASVDQELGALMDRLRRQTSPLEPEQGRVPIAN